MIFQLHKVTGDKMVGYLTGDFTKGNVPEGFVHKLEKIEQDEKIKLQTLGFHLCEYCKDERSSMDHAHEGYIWPDMLRHYISKHLYLPPQEFIDFIMTY